MHRKDLKKFTKIVKEKFDFDVNDIVKTKGNHAKVYITNGSETMFVITASTPSDHRSFKNAVAQAGRLFSS